MVPIIVMRALALIVLALPLTLADPVVARGERIPRQDTAIFPPNGLPNPSTGTGTGTSTSSASTSTPLVIFTNSINSELTTCQSSSITWLSGGPEVLISLSISNVGVTQNSPPTSSNPGQGSSNTKTNGAITRRADPTSTTDGTVVYTLADNVDTTLGKYTWDKVNVPQGWYIFIALDTSTKAFLGKTGLSFFVRNGTDVSCLQGQSTSTSQPSTPASQTSQPTNTDPGATTGAAQTKHTNIGGIVGGVVGGAAVLALVALAYGCLRRRSNKHSSANDEGGVEDRGAKPAILPFGRWGKLGSGTFNDKDRDPAAAEVGNGVVATSATRSIGRPRSRSGAGGGFFAGVLKSSSSSQSPKKTSSPKKPKKPYYTPRHNSHSESMGGILGGSATTTVSSAFQGDEEYNPYTFERPVPMSPISAGGSSAASSFRASAVPADVRSPFSDPGDQDADSVVYGLYNTTHESHTGLIPIGYDGPPIPSNAPTPSPVPSYLQSHYESSTGAVAGHSSDSDRADSRRSSRGHHERAHSYSAFRDSGEQQQQRMRAQTLLGGMYTLPNSRQQTLPETPRNDSMLTFSTSSSSAANSRRGSKTHATPNSSPSIPMQASPSMQSTSTMASQNASGTFGANTTRRAVRKPVPTYSPEEAGNTTNAAAGSSSAFSSPASSPTMPSPLTSGEGTVSDGQREIYRQHELLHKDSMGSMKGMAKMHVLIPDMPPPQRG